MKQIGNVSKMYIIISSTFADGFNEEIFLQLAKWHTHILVDIFNPRLETD